ncbi:MAG: CinA family nicotinamide mononucleotide deamidase-related protein [Gemmatimonadetes bacterium]|nr:CinA family nicotinamide mononucleotide deamidase-related protein [Gemmatimonadota bacterium]
MSGIVEHMIRTVVVTVGDELLLGDTVDSNAARIGRALAELGAPVTRRETVGDEAQAIQAAVGRALADGDLVIVTGGLGPTPDDLTREAVARLLGRPLRLDPDVEAALRARYRAAGYRDFPETNLRQAMVPAGGRVLPNERGTAPGLALEREGRWVVLLQGVPRELEGMLAGPVADLVREVFVGRLRPPVHRRLRTTGIAESKLAERVEELLPPERGPVRLAYLPSLRGVDLRFTVAGDVEHEEASGWLDRMEGALSGLSGHLFPGADLVEAVALELERSGRTLAVAESCTGGLIAMRLTDRSGSSRWFLGGVVAYADRAKVEQLGVPAETIAQAGAVSEEVARALAEGARRAFGADTGIGITGIAGPTGGTPEKPVGTVWYAVAVGERVDAEHRRFMGDREAVRERSAQAALNLLYRTLVAR